MKKGNSVTKKVQRRRGGNIPKTPKNPIETLPKTQQTRRQPPRTQRPRTQRPINRDSLLQETYELLGITGIPPRSN
jgi:hypothetical protein